MTALTVITYAATSIYFAAPRIKATSTLSESSPGA
jgi:hypothetical protein